MSKMVFWKPIRALGWVYAGGALAKLLGTEWSHAIALGLTAGAMWLVGTLAAEQDAILDIGFKLAGQDRRSDGSWLVERPMSVGWKVVWVAVGLAGCWYAIDSGHGQWSTLLLPTMVFVPMVLFRMQERGSSAVSSLLSTLRERMAQARTSPEEVAFLEKYAKELVELSKQQILASTPWGARAARETYRAKVNELRSREGLPPLTADDIRLY